MLRRRRLPVPLALLLVPLLLLLGRIEVGLGARQRVGVVRQMRHVRIGLATAAAGSRAEGVADILSGWRLDLLDLLRHGEEEMRKRSVAAGKRMTWMSDERPAGSPCR
jgi:hypothetical protein